MNIAPLIMVEAAAGGGGGGLAIVQQPAVVDAPGGESPVIEGSFTAVGSGNSAAMWLATPTSNGAPTITDSGGGTWTLLYSHEATGGSEATFRFYKRDSATGITWVRATFGGDTGGLMGRAEFSGAGTGLTLDDSDSGTQSTDTAWTFPYTSTVNDTFAICLGSQTNNSASTGVSPLTSTSTGGDYSFSATGTVVSAGSGTLQVNLADGRNGDKAWVLLRPGT